jgi:hypothetical protein
MLSVHDEREGTVFMNRLLQQNNGKASVGKAKRADRPSARSLLFI